jgi:4-amino-4-deoxy-L-arabinose transferase-like glycosyltransferase
MAGQMSDRKWIGILLLAGFLFLFPGIGDLPLLDRDEPRFSRAAVEMMERSDWVVPWFNGGFRFDKPPLTYWLMSPWLSILGETEMAVRMPTVLSALASMWLIYAFARRLGLPSGKCALAAGGWLTCLQVMIHGRIAVADMHMLVMLIVTMRAVWELGSAKTEESSLLKSRWFHVLWLSMGLGFLAKGPLAIVVPLAALLLLFVWEKWKGAPDQKMARKMLGFWAWAQLPALGLVALWGIPALLATRGLFFEVGIGTHVVDRGLQGFNHRKVIPGIYYLIVLPLFFAPWTGALAGAFAAAREPERDSRFLACWTIAPILIFSGYATQLPHYILPAYPALFLLLAKGWDKGLKRARLILAALPFTIFGLLAIVITYGSVKAVAFDSALSGMLAGLAMVLTGISLASLAVGLHRRILPFAAMAFAVIGFQVMAHNASEVHAVKRLIKKSGGEFHHPAAVGFTEPSLVWYGSHQWVFQKEFPPDADFCVSIKRRWRADGKTCLAIWRGERPEAKDGAKGLSIPDGAMTVQGWSAADSSWVELVFWRPEEASH